MNWSVIKIACGGGGTTSGVKVGATDKAGAKRRETARKVRGTSRLGTETFEEIVVGTKQTVGSGAESPRNRTERNDAASFAQVGNDAQKERR